MVTETTEVADFIVEGETYQTWYKIVGDLKTGARRPLVVLHGGPGLSHDYMLPNALLYEKASIPIVFYDQLGGGRSTHRPDAPKDFWSPELFMDELDNLLNHLGIHDDFDLLGHSWGGMLGAQYAASRSPKGLKRLIVSNAPASMDLFEAGTTALLEEFPAEVVKMLRKHESDGTTHEQEYQIWMQKFYQKHICTVDPWPQVLLDALKLMESEPTVYQTMQGPSEFTVTGTLKGWTIIDILHKISCPTLLLSAPLDEIQEPAVLPFFLKVPKIKWVELQNSTHLAQFEEPEKYFKVLLDFLEGTEVAN